MELKIQSDRNKIGCCDSILYILSNRFLIKNINIISFQVYSIVHAEKSKNHALVHIPCIVNLEELDGSTIENANFFGTVPVSHLFVSVGMEFVIIKYSGLCPKRFKVYGRYMFY